MRSSRSESIFRMDAFSMWRRGYLYTSCFVCGVLGVQVGGYGVCWYIVFHVDGGGLVEEGGFDKKKFQGKPDIAI